MAQSNEPNLTTPVAGQRVVRNGIPALSLDVNHASCQVLAALAGGQPLPEEAFSTLIEHNRKLAHAPDEEIVDSLTRQSVLLERLWLHFAARAASEPRPDRAAILMKAALNCQRALSGVLGTVHHLSQVKKNG